MVTTTRRSQLAEVMNLAWQFIKRNGFSRAEALKIAWVNNKLKAEMRKRIVKFYFQKVDGTIREAYGTLSNVLIPASSSESGRKKNDTVQVFFDSEKQEFRSFKKANLVRMA